MKELWDKKGHLTPHGEDLTREFEKIAAKFIQKQRPSGRDTLYLEMLMQRAVTFKATMYRLSIQGLAKKG